MNKITPEFIVKDVDATIKYYENILGFEIVAAVPEKGAKEWAMMKCGEAEIMIESAEAAGAELPHLASIPEKPSGVLLYIETENLADFWRKIEPQADIIQKIHNTPYGAREFVIRDLNGFTLIFGERAEK
jgi:uncharacterized glyoxalase superfamily protein PhnB